MDNKPLLSIIIPAYNAEKYIQRTLKSVSQCHLNYELIIIDDGSIDNTWDIIKNYESTHVNVRAFHKTNGGVSSARNMGLRKANGEYVLFLDADDLLTKEITNLEKIMRTKKADVIKFNYKAQRIFKFIFKYKTCFEGGIKDGFLDIDNARKEILLTTNFNNTCFQVVKACIAKKVKFSEKYILAEDLDYNLKVYDKAKTLYYFQKPVIKYMYNSSSATRYIDVKKCKKQLSDMEAVYGKLYRYKDKWKMNIADEDVASHIESTFGLFERYTGFKRGS